MIQKMQRTVALSFSAVSLVTFLTAVSTAPAHAMGPATFFVGLGKTMANMAKEPFEIILLPVEMMKEDSEVMGPVRSKDVAKAQSEIIAIARKLESEGKLVLKSEGEDEYVL